MIRKAEIKDLPEIVEIYNQAVINGFATADTEVMRIEDKMDWFLEHDNDFPIFVFDESDKIIGWLSISPYRKGRKALRFTVEISYYVHNDYKRQGIASRLIAFGLEKCLQLGYKSVFGIILERNVQSINLLKKFGFEQWAFMPGIADFNGEECGHVYMGKRICS